MLPKFCVAVLSVSALTLAGCSSGPAEPAETAETVTIGDAWVKAVDSGMTAAFGRLANTGTDDVRIISATSPAAERVELHEVVADGGAMMMREKDGGIVIPAGAEIDLQPGGDHLMLMDVTAHLTPGADVEIVATFEDGSTLPIAAQVRDFPGADENYEHDAHG